MDAINPSNDNENKVSVSIKEINNGFIFDRHWSEKDGKETKYCDEQYFVKKLPGALNYLFKPGYLKDKEPESNAWDEAEEEMEEKIENEINDRKKKEKDY